MSKGPNHKRKSLKERFEAKVERLPSGCWRWTGYITDRGYGGIVEGGKNGRSLYAHRVAYALYVGPIPDGLQTDHLCRNRWCVNPDHLEAVTQQENILRGDMPSAVIRRGGRAEPKV